MQEFIIQLKSKRFLKLFVYDITYAMQTASNQTLDGEGAA